MMARNSTKFVVCAGMKRSKISVHTAQWTDRRELKKIYKVRAWASQCRHLSSDGDATIKYLFNLVGI